MAASQSSAWRAYADRAGVGLQAAGGRVRVVRDVQRAGEFAFGDGERAEGHVKFVGYLLGGERSSHPEEPAGASQGDHGAGGPSFRSAVTYDAEAGSGGE